MSYWISTRVTVGFKTVPELNEFINAVSAEDTVLSFEKLKPVPDNISGEDLTSWRKWHWGISCQPSVSREYENIHFWCGEYQMRYSFDNQWTTPGGIFDALVKRFPHAKVEWFWCDEDYSPWIIPAVEAGVKLPLKTQQQPVGRCGNIERWPLWKRVIRYLPDKIKTVYRRIRFNNRPWLCRNSLKFTWT